MPPGSLAWQPGGGGQGRTRAHDHEDPSQELYGLETNRRWRSANQTQANLALGGVTQVKSAIVLPKGQLAKPWPTWPGRSNPSEVGCSFDVSPEMIGKWRT